MKYFFVVAFYSIGSIGFSQNSNLISTSDSSKNKHLSYWDDHAYNLPTDIRKKRTKLVAIANISAYTGALAGLYTFWYSNYPQSSFHFFNDIPENLQVDKISHSYGAYMQGRLSTEMWKWAGLNNRKATLIGGLSGLAYEGIIETLDGFSAQWGWSWGDIGANFFGTAVFLSQEYFWHEQRISIKYSTHINDYKQYNQSIQDYADKKFGTSFIQRLLEDYNTQTYWMSANIKSFFPKTNVPNWLNIAVGYGAEGMFGSKQNVPIASNIERYRQWYLAPDIDFTRIKTNNKFIKYALVVLNCFKFPTPSLELSQGKVKWNWFHF